MRSTERGARARAAVLLAFAFQAIFFTGVFPPFANPNDLSHFQTVVAMAEFKTFSIDRALQTLGDHEDKARAQGHFYSNKAPGLAFAAYPVYRLLRLALPPPSSGTSDPIFYLTRLFTVSLLCGIALWRFMRRLDEGQPPADVAAIVAAAAAFGTPFLYYSRSFFSHAWAAALLFLAWDRLRRAEEAAVGRLWLSATAGLLAGWACISEYATALIALALAARAVAPRDMRRLAAFAAGAAAPIGLLAVYDTVCFGAPWILSSAREATPEYSQLVHQGAFGFGAPSLKIAAAYLIDPARGVLLFSPFLLWSVFGFFRWWRSGKQRADCVFVVAAVGAYFVALTGYANWHGGWSLGSRYLLPALWLAALPIARALETALSRGLFLAAVTYAVATHVLLSSSWVHFPPDFRWPAAAGSAWFLRHGWVARNLASGIPASAVPALLLSVAVVVAALLVAARAAEPVRPAMPVALLVGVAPLIIVLLSAPEPPYGGRLWRAAMLGAFSGRDDAREELKGVGLAAVTPEEQRRAVAMWRAYGPRR